MPLFAWDNPDASAGEDKLDSHGQPEEDDQVELPTVDKIELKGAQEAYANTFDTDFDDDNVAMYAGFKEQGLSCASMEETSLPQEKRFRKTIDWVMKADDARINGMCGRDKHVLFAGCDRVGLSVGLRRAQSRGKKEPISCIAPNAQ